jgi:CHAT domain-containing protein/tetratricopeptide (TPR) repeat protein
MRTNSQSPEATIAMRSRERPMRRLTLGRRLTFACLIALGLAVPVDPVRAQSPREVEKLYDEVTALAQAGRHAEAAAIAQRLTERARTEAGEGSVAYARGISWQAYLLQARGRFDQAEKLFDAALAIYQLRLPPGHPDIATTVNNLGFIYQITDRLDRAEVVYKQALAMREAAKPPAELQVAESLNNLAQAYKRQGRAAEAVPLLLRALALRTAGLPPTHLMIAQSLLNLGSAFELLGRFDAAEPLYRKVLDLRRAGLGPEHAEVAAAIGKIGEILFKLGRHAEAEPLLKQAIEVRYRTQSAGHIDVATSLAARGENLAAMGRNEEAKASLRNALAIQQSVLPQLHPSIAKTQALLGRVARQEGDKIQGHALLRVAAVSQAARSRPDELAVQHFSEFVAAAWDVAASGPARPEIVSEALEMAQRASVTQTGVSIARMASRFAAGDGELRDLVRARQDLDQMASLLDQELNAALSQSMLTRQRPTSSIQDDIEKVSAEKVALDTTLQTRFPTYAQLVSPEPLTIPQIRSLLTPEEAILHYFCGTDAIYVWAFTSTATYWQKLATPIVRIRDVVSRMRSALDIERLAAAGTRADLFDLDDAHSLYQALIEPVEIAVRGKAHLIAVPCGPMTSLPPHLLVRTKAAVARPGLAQLALYREADWLIKHHSISILPSLGSLHAIRSVAQKPKSTLPMVGFGNPIFDVKFEGLPGSTASQTTRSGLPDRPATGTRSFGAFWRGGGVDRDAVSKALAPLPETEVELRAVAQRVSASPDAMFVGAMASETTVKSMNLADYRIVYFATHGLVAGELAGLGEPALALSLPSTPTELDDGLLTASEVSQLSLDADWVVLSACNTADGDAVGAEALSGLAKSFFHAGARSLLVSHWRVASDTTKQLTTTLFDIANRKPAASKAAILQETILTLMTDKTDPWNAYPAFWGPFVVVGEVRR